MNKDISKAELYKGVKALLETTAPHIVLTQHKLFTLYSLAFQYLLFLSTKNPGYYILRPEGPYLAEKIGRKAKDDISRKFMQKILIPRRLKYGQSTFYLDFFHTGTWAITKDLPRDKIRAALIIKDTIVRPMKDIQEENTDLVKELPPDYYLTSLTDFIPRTITIAYDCKNEKLHPVEFPFIEKKDDPLPPGVKLASNLIFQED